MDKMWFSNEDDVKSFEWVVWGDKSQCCLFGKTYEAKGWAVRNAKKRIALGDTACVIKPQNGSFYRVMFGNALSDFLLEVVQR